MGVQEWSHPYFISYEEYQRLLEGTGVFASASSENWRVRHFMQSC